MREIRTSGSMSGRWKRGMVRYSGTGNRKGRQRAWLPLNHRATSRLYSYHLGVSAQRFAPRVSSQREPGLYDLQDEMRRSCRPGAARPGSGVGT